MAPAIDHERYGLAETKDKFSALTAKANSTGRPFTVLKGGKPWVEVRPPGSMRKHCDGDNHYALKASGSRRRPRPAVCRL